MVVTLSGFKDDIPGYTTTDRLNIADTLSRLNIDLSSAVRSSHHHSL